MSWTDALRQPTLRKALDSVIIILIINIATAAQTFASLSQIVLSPLFILLVYATIVTFLLRIGDFISTKAK
jgi:hypothetical protein